MVPNFPNAQLISQVHHGGESTFYAANIGEDYPGKSGAVLHLFFRVFFPACDDEVGFENFNTFGMKIFGSSDNGDLFNGLGSNTKFGTPDQCMFESQIEEVFCPTGHEAHDSHVAR